MTDTYINSTVETTTASTNALSMPNDGDALFVANSGSLIALGNGSDGLDMSGEDQLATIDGAVFSAQSDGILMSGGFGSLVTVNGDVSGWNGIVVSDNSDTVIVNGTIDGTEGMTLGGDGDSASIAGTVSASDVAVAATGQADVIRVSGLVQGVGFEIGTGVDLENEAQQLDIGAKGEVYGSTEGVYISDATGDTIENSGHISGLEDGVDGYGAAGLTLVNDGTINGISLGFSGGTIRNSGLISSETGSVAINIYSQSTGLNIENSGTIHGDLDVDGTSAVNVSNSGNWNGQIDIQSSSNSITNSGNIAKGVAFGAAGVATSTNVIDNEGIIHGGVAFYVSTGSASGDTLSNSGSIFGAVQMGTGETLTNTGMIHGNIFFATGGATPSDDTFDNSNGIVIGSINGGSGGDTFIIGAGNNIYNPGGKSDHFDFGASFGNDVINNFSTSGGHDTIQFSGGDFTSWSELQSHMIQVGANTVITLEPGSAIELTHTLITHLVASEFIFT